MEHIERTKILQQQQSYTDLSQSPHNKLVYFLRLSILVIVVYMLIIYYMPISTSGIRLISVARDLTIFECLQCHQSSSALKVIELN